MAETVIPPVNPIDPEGQPAVSPADAMQNLQNQLEAAQAMQVLAEEERDNAKKDIMAMKLGKKRAEVNLAQPEAAPVTPVASVTPPTALDPAIMAELAESRRVNAELARALQSRGAMPTGGAGQAESPAPKPLGYWSPEDKATLKKRGWSDDKILRAETTARMGSATGRKQADSAGVPKRKY